MNIKNYLFCMAIVISALSCKTLSIVNTEPLDNIVLITGDTLYGKVDYFKERLVYNEFYKKIRLRDTNGRKKRFKRKNIVSFRVDGANYKSFWLNEQNQYFKSGTIIDSRYLIDPSGNQYFLKVAHKGKLSHYQLEWIDLDNNTIELADLIKKAEDNFFVSGENRLFGLKRKLISEYLSDCPEIQKKLLQKDFKWTFQVVDFYNENCVQE